MFLYENQDIRYGIKSDDDDEIEVMNEDLVAKISQKNK